MDDTAKAEFKGRLEALFGQRVAHNEVFRCEDGIKRGFASVSTFKDPEGKFGLVQMVVTSLREGSQVFNTRVPKAQIEHTSECGETAREFFREKGFVDPALPLTPELFAHRLRMEINHLQTQRAAEFPPLGAADAEAMKVPASTLATYQSEVDIPSGASPKNKNIALRFQIRPIAEAMMAGKQYLPTPIEISITTRSTDMKHAQALLAKANEVFHEKGFLEFDASQNSQQNLGKKAIPREWVVPEHVTVELPGNRQYYNMRVVKRTVQTRRPLISLGLGTTDGNRAAAMRDVVVNEFLPLYAPGGARDGKDITLDDMASFIHERIPPDPTQRSAIMRNDVREIVIDGRPVMALRTPAMRRARTAGGEMYHEYELRMTPPLGPDVSSQSARTVSGSLNTSNPELALHRLTLLQDLAQIAIRDYLRDHPRMEIVTAMGEKNIGDRKRPVRVFRMPGIGERLPADRMFFDELAEKVIRPGLANFDRYLYWQTTVTALEKHRWEVRFQAFRNDGEPVAQAAGPFGGQFAVTAPTQAEAEAFAQDLRHAILREQHLFSRERPVEQFGEPTLNAVLRESLRETLQAHAETMDLQGNNLLSQLQRASRELSRP
jgi:hypothetical protein